MNRAHEAQHQTAVQPSPARYRRSMPGWARDKIHDGVPISELRAYGGTKAIYGALVSTAMSAIQAGHHWPEWHAELTSPSSRLGQQARLDKRRRDIGSRQHTKFLLSAWRRAETRIAEAPPFTSGEVRSRAGGLLDAIEETPWTATGAPADQLVYRHAVSEALRRGHTRPVLPIRGIHEATGVPRMTAARALARLTEAGLLRLHRPGQRSAETASHQRRRAGIYVVPALLVPEPHRPLVLRTLCPTSPDPMSHFRACQCPTPEEAHR